MISKCISTLLLSFLFIVFVQITQAQAWKIDVHIWIAQELLNDAQDGSIEIEIEGEKRKISLPPKYVDALNTHPKSFLLASIGPDAFPDVIAGQMVIHPAVHNGWGANDWLRHLLNTPNLTLEETAFALGFFTHAAADIFGHTFVNRYAGDHFELEDHPWVAIRHINIEAFVSNYLPDLVDPKTGVKITPIDAVKTDGKIRIPASFIAERLLLNGDAVAQFKKSGNAEHLVAAYELHQTLERFTEDDGLMESISENIKQYIIEAKLGVELSNKTIDELTDIQLRIHRKLDDTALDAARYLGRVNDEVHDIEAIHIDVIEKGLETAFEISQELSNAIDYYAKIHGEISRLTEEFKRTSDKIFEKKCSLAKKFFGIPAKIACKFVRKNNPHYYALKAVIESKNRQLAVVSSVKKHTDKKLRNAIETGIDFIRRTHKEKRDISNSVIALLEGGPFGDPSRNRFESWRDSISPALIEYSRANVETLLNTIDPDNPYVFDPLLRWKKCYGPVFFLGLPIQVANAHCQVRTSISEIKAAVDNLEKRILSVDPLGSKWVKIQEKIEGELKQLQSKLFQSAIAEGLKQFDSYTGEKSLNLYKAFHHHVGPNELNQVMLSDEGSSGLLIVPDAASRLEAEMGLTRGKFDPNEFNAIYNSISLSKLALLNRDGLVELAKLVGLSETSYGPWLYQDSTKYSENILYGFARNLDGNNQWHELSPPHPRKKGFDELDFKARANARTLEGEGSICSLERQKKNGLRLWVDLKARESLFKSIFRGKVSPGIDLPKELSPNFEKVLSDSYPLNIDENNDWNKVDSLRVFKAMSNDEPIVFQVTGSGTREQTLKDLGPDSDRFKYRFELKYESWVDFREDGRIEKLFNPKPFKRGFANLEGTHETYVLFDSSGLPGNVTLKTFPFFSEAKFQVGCDSFRTLVQSDGFSLLKIPFSTFKARKKTFAEARKVNQEAEKKWWDEFKNKASQTQFKDISDWFDVKGFQRLDESDIPILKGGLKEIERRNTFNR